LSRKNIFFKEIAEKAVLDALPRALHIHAGIFVV